MVRFLFWNINKKPLTNIIAKLVTTHNIDILMVAESEINPALMLSKLNEQTPEYFWASENSNCERIHIFTRFSISFIKPIWEDAKTTIRKLELPVKKDVLLAVTHLPSKLYRNENEQALDMPEFIGIIRQVEEEREIDRTIIVGDLNMNPFEFGIISAKGLHAIQSRDVVKNESRMVDGKDYPYFYNPMWNLFGDFENKVQGTYFYSSGGKSINYFWYMFDQVLIRPTLISAFINEELRIITSVSDISLLNRNQKPDQKRYSDHLPLLFEIRF